MYLPHRWIATQRGPQKTPLFYCCARSLHGNVFTTPLPNSEVLQLSSVVSQYNRAARCCYIYIQGMYIYKEYSKYSISSIRLAPVGLLLECNILLRLSVLLNSFHLSQFRNTWSVLRFVLTYEFILPTRALKHDVGIWCSIRAVLWHFTNRN
jgi:hypothetical protein